MWSIWRFSLATFLNLFNNLTFLLLYITTQVDKQIKLIGLDE